MFPLPEIPLSKTPSVRIVKPQDEKNMAQKRTTINLARACVDALMKTKVEEKN